MGSEMCIRDSKDTDLQKRTKFNVEDWEERYINQEQQESDEDIMD